MQFFIAVNNPRSFLHARLGWETLPTLAHEFESKVDLRGCVRLPYVLLVMSRLNSASCSAAEKFDGQELTRDALPTELLPGLVGETGVEPMTDNPMSSAHRSTSADAAAERTRGGRGCCLLLYSLSYSLARGRTRTANQQFR